MMEVGLVFDLQLCFESSNQRVTVGTSVGGVLETVHTERYPGHKTAADGTEDTSRDPGHGASLHYHPGGHQGPAVRAGRGHWLSPYFQGWASHHHHLGTRTRGCWVAVLRLLS